MIWLTWRQHRGELLGAAILLVFLGVLLVAHGLPMHRAFDRDGIAACQSLVLEGAGPATGESCAALLESFDTQYLWLPTQFAAWLPFLPMLAGMLVGAPMLAREYEQGTWQLVWTQGVTRTRWLVTKLALLLGGVAVVSVVFAVGVSWWFEPLAPQPFVPERFNHAVLVFTGYVVLAVAIGVLVGAVVRRAMLAAALTVAGYLLVRIPVEFGLRPHYRPPLTGDSAGAEGWILGSGQPIASQTSAIVTYQPADRYWQFQLIETTILLGLTAILLLISWWLVLGRKDRSSPETTRPVRVARRFG